MFDALRYNRRCQLIISFLRHTGRMHTLHLVSGPSTAGALRIALDTKTEYQQDRVAWFPDSLSVGPLEARDPVARLQWWQWWADMVTAQTGQPASRPGEKQEAFWQEVSNADRLVLWHGQGDAHDSAFFHAMCDKLPEKAFSLVTVNGATGAHAADELAVHLSHVRAITVRERAAARAVWKRLEQENRPFRVLSHGKLISAPADCYDSALLHATGPHWTPITHVVAPVMASMGIGDAPLFWRIKLLTESGALIADGDAWLVQRSRVKHAQKQSN